MDQSELYRRFPSTRPKKMPTPRVVTHAEREEGIIGLHNALTTALPLLLAHANTEPYAKALNLKKGLRKGYTAGWEFYRKDYIRSYDSYHPSTSRIWFLTEGGYIAETAGGYPPENDPITMDVNQRLRPLSEATISKVWPEGIPPYQSATRNLTGILARAGIKVELPTPS